MPKFIDLSHKTFSRLTVQDCVVLDQQTYWYCTCSCGNEQYVRSASLRSGKTKSCGCLQKESAAKHIVTTKKHSTHKLSDSNEHAIWQAMKQRCHNPNNRQYKNYGGRGIYVCDRWKESFENFYSDMGPKPQGLTLDRIDNNGPYTPENCHWTTPKEQARNLRKNRIVTYKGRTLPLVTLCDELNLKHKPIYKRIFERGWDVKKAIEQPLQKRNSTVVQLSFLVWLTLPALLA